jgi:drug/metabolite transporter (DMT)-like permease
MLGEALALAAALVWSLSVVLFRRAELPPQAMNLFKNSVALVLLALTMVILDLPIDSQRDASDWWRLIISGVLGIAIADTFTFMALERLGASSLAVIDCLYAPTIVLLSVLWLGESLSIHFAFGALLVVGGVALSASSKKSSQAGQAKPTRRSRGVLFATVGIVAMAIGVILAKPALERGHLVEVTLVRIAAGWLVQMAFVSLVPSERKALNVFKPQPAWRSLLPASLLGSYVAMLLWLGGFKWAPASRAAVLNQMSTVSTIVLAWLVLGEPLTLRRSAGALLAIVGAIAILLGAQAA